MSMRVPISNLGQIAHPILAAIAARFKTTTDPITSVTQDTTDDGSKRMIITLSPEVTATLTPHPEIWNNQILFTISPNGTVQAGLLHATQPGQIQLISRPDQHPAILPIIEHIRNSPGLLAPPGNA